VSYKSVKCWGLYPHKKRITDTLFDSESFNRKPAIALEGIKYINLRGNRVRLTFWEREDCLLAKQLTGWNYSEEKPNLLETYVQGEYLVCKRQKILYDNVFCIKERLIVEK